MAESPSPHDASLLAGDAHDFAAFYRRHEDAVLSFFLRRTGGADLAADLTAETFARALAGRQRFDPALDDEAIARINELDGYPAVAALEELPADQRAAVVGRVVDERSYAELARRLQCSESVVRQRVSRGLRILRNRLDATR
jgi:DNA-directed RNA polymerase specialized sigma24 family protein